MKRILILFLILNFGKTICMAPELVSTANAPSEPAKSTLVDSESTPEKQYIKDLIKLKNRRIIVKTIKDGDDSKNIESNATWFEARRVVYCELLKNPNYGFMSRIVDYILGNSKIIKQSEMCLGRELDTCFRDISCI